MKQFAYLFAFVALALGLGACEVVSEDAFPTDPVAPALYDHADILMTSNTMDEDVNFSWKAARFVDVQGYDLIGEYEGNQVLLASTKELYYKLSKSSFKDLLYSKFSLPENTTFSMNFYVKCNAAQGTFTSPGISLNIYAYGNAVAAVLNAAASEYVLDVANPTALVNLLSWEPARLNYHEAITYNVYIKGNDGEWQAVATGLTDLAYMPETDALNEACVRAGAEEGAASDMIFAVKAFSDTYPDGVISNETKIKITTYVATFPDTLYVPGSYQGWDPASAATMKQSAVTKGFYEAVLDLRTADGSDVEFKFSPNPAWVDDFSFGDLTIGTFGNGYTDLRGKGIVSDNIKVPSGLYNVVVNKKLNTIYMVQIETLSLIGEAVGGWDRDVDLTWNAVDKTFTGEADMVAGAFKIRVNHDWTHSAGGAGIQDISFTAADNLNFTRSDSHYRIILHTDKTPYYITFADANFPEALYVPGDHQGWDPATAPMLAGNGSGQYEGFVTLNTQFKFTSYRDWGHLNYGGSFENLDTDGGAGNFAVDPGYYLLKVDLATMTASATAINRVGVIGSFNGWGTPDAEMTYDAANDVWVVENLEFPVGTEWKFRMNNDWAINLGGNLDNLTQDGSNIACPDGGIVNITLKISTPPYSATVTVAGAVTPKYGTQATLAGDYSGHTWNATSDPQVFGTGNGVFTSVVTMYNMTHGFKLVENGNWIGGDPVAETTYDYLLYQGDNMSIPNGTYYWKFDLPNKKATALPVTSVGLIGSFAASNTWSKEVAMTFDEVSLTYKATVELAAGDEFLVRFNENWDYKLCGDMNQLKTWGDNCKVAESGTYTVVLDMANTAKITLTK